MANLAGEITLQVRRHGIELHSRTDYTWSGGGLVLTIATVIPASGLAFELISTYAAAPGTDTIITHVTLGHDGPPQISSDRHAEENRHPVTAPRGCAYDHAERLLDELTELDVTVEITDATFTELERVE
jgi:hypothetical protein